MAQDKPSVFPRWASDTENNGTLNSPNKVEPTELKKDKGWAFPEKPPRGEFNWWMNNVSEWVTYLQENAGRRNVRFFNSQQ